MATHIDVAKLKPGDIINRATLEQELGMKFPHKQWGFTLMDLVQSIHAERAQSGSPITVVTRGHQTRLEVLTADAANDYWFSLWLSDLKSMRRHTRNHDRLVNTKKFQKVTSGSVYTARQQHMTAVNVKTLSEHRAGLKRCKNKTIRKRLKHQSKP